jgi:hypothetical protein
VTVLGFIQCTPALAFSRKKCHRDALSGPHDSLAGLLLGGPEPEVSDRPIVAMLGPELDLRMKQVKIQAAGASTLRQIAAELNALEIPTARGGEWSAVQVQRVLRNTSTPAASGS